MGIQARNYDVLVTIPAEFCGRTFHKRQVRENSNRNDLKFSNYFAETLTNTVLANKTNLDDVLFFYKLKKIARVATTSDVLSGCITYRSIDARKWYEVMFKWVVAHCCPHFLQVGWFSRLNIVSFLTRQKNTF